ncbi:MAG: hypothetical protein ACWA5Q_09005 [bacterium]
MKLIKTIILAFSIFLIGCSDSIKLANYNMEDSSIADIIAESSPTESPDLLSAFFGLDGETPTVSSFVVCRGAAGKDASPVIFPYEVNLETLQAGDFKVVSSDGSEGKILCVTPAPAFDVGELRTILLVGEYGSSSNQPATVEVIGNLLSIDNRINFKGKIVNVTPLEDGPSIVLAELVPSKEWELGKRATFLPFGGGSGCPKGTTNIIRVVWSGGITKPGGKEVDDLERQSYTVTIRDNHGDVSSIAPFALGDLDDGDNNHKLCLNVEGVPIKVAFPEGLMTDPREDLNPKTSIEVTTTNAG